eukprot:superscaffoldBa00000229_g2932
MLIEGGKYTFNFTAAKAACLSLNVTIATRTQIERAVQRGLEMCKFGWIDGQVAVIPRITADKNCGKGKTGVVPWSIFHCRSQGQQKDDIETEMWKHTDSEMDLHGQQGAEEEDDGEETDRKYSSDVMLFVNPDIKTNSAE